MRPVREELTKSWVDEDLAGGLGLLPKPVYFPPCDGGRSLKEIKANQKGSNYAMYNLESQVSVLIMVFIILIKI